MKIETHRLATSKIYWVESSLTQFNLMLHAFVYDETIRKTKVIGCSKRETNISQKLYILINWVHLIFQFDLIRLASANVEHKIITSDPVRYDTVWHGLAPFHPVQCVSICFPFCPTIFVATCPRRYFCFLNFICHFLKV